MSRHAILLKRGSRYSRMTQVKFVEWYGLPKHTIYHFEFFKGCLPQILLDPFLNTLTHVYSHSLACWIWKVKYFARKKIKLNIYSNFPVTLLPMTIRGVWLSSSTLSFFISLALTQKTFTCSMSTTETLKKGAKYV